MTEIIIDHTTELVTPPIHYLEPYTEVIGTLEKIDLTNPISTLVISWRKQIKIPIEKIQAESLIPHQGDSIRVFKTEKRLIIQCPEGDPNDR